MISTSSLVSYHSVPSAGAVVGALFRASKDNGFQLVAKKSQLKSVGDLYFKVVSSNHLNNLHSLINDYRTS
jgi:hypothetical protein